MRLVWGAVRVTAVLCSDSGCAMQENGSGPAGYIQWASNIDVPAGC